MVRALRIDCHNGGPIVYNDLLNLRMEYLLNQGVPIGNAVRQINLYRKDLLFSGQYPEYEEQLNKSGVSIMIRTVGIFGDPPFSADCIVKDINLLKEVCDTSGINFISDFSAVESCLSNKNKGYIPMIESIEGFRDDQELLFCLCETVLPIVQPVYNTGNFFGSGCYDEADVGLSNIGRNMLSLFSLADTILDHSHISEKTSMDILETGFYRNIATHTSSFALTHNKRGKSDTLLKAFGEAGGFVAITVNPNLVSIDGLSTKEAFLRNTEHILRIVGENQVGIGTDWDGPMPSSMVKSLALESKKLGNSHYYLDLYSNLYNKMSDWDSMFSDLTSWFGEKLAQKISGLNTFCFLKKHMRKATLDESQVCDFYNVCP